MVNEPKFTGQINAKTFDTPSGKTKATVLVLQAQALRQSPPRQFESVLPAFSATQKKTTILPHYLYFLLILSSSSSTGTVCKMCVQVHGCVLMCVHDTHINSSILQLPPSFDYM